MECRTIVKAEWDKSISYWDGQSPRGSHHWVFDLIIFGLVQCFLQVLPTHVKCKNHIIKWLYPMSSNIPALHGKLQMICRIPCQSFWPFTILYKASIRNLQQGSFVQFGDWDLRRISTGINCPFRNLLTNRTFFLVFLRFWILECCLPSFRLLIHPGIAKHPTCENPNWPSNNVKHIKHGYHG